MSFKVTASTMGRSNPSPVTLSGGYHYQRDPTWTPNDPRYRETAPASHLAGGEARAARRKERVREFGRILASLGAPDPASAPLALVIEAGKQLGVGEKTARSYRADLKGQGGAS